MDGVSGEVLHTQNAEGARRNAKSLRQKDGFLLFLTGVVFDFSGSIAVAILFFVILLLKLKGVEQWRNSSQTSPK